MEPGREVARRAIRRVHGWRQDYHFERTYLAFRSWFRFRSRSDRWCAIEPRGEGLGGGVRSQGGQKRSEDFLERSERRTPPPYNRPRSHRAFGGHGVVPVGVGGVRENAISVLLGWAWCRGALDSAAVRGSRTKRCQS